MRIIGGSLKGRKFQPSAKFKGRPTTDFAREALFNILTHRVDLPGCHVLDLFAGTGALTYEFASRGAARVTAVEKDFSSCSFIRSTLKTLGIEGGAVVRDDVYRFLTLPQATYDVVIADPPYDDQHLGQLPQRVKNSGCLSEGGLFILEHGAEHKFSTEDGCDETRRYGAVHFSFFTFEV